MEHTPSIVYQKRMLVMALMITAQWGVCATVSYSFLLALAHSLHCRLSTTKILSCHMAYYNNNWCHKSVVADCPMMGSWPLKFTSILTRVLNFTFTLTRSSKILISQSIMKRLLRHHEYIMFKSGCDPVYSEYPAPEHHWQYARRADKKLVCSGHDVLNCLQNAISMQSHSQGCKITDKLFAKVTLVHLCLH